MSDERRKQIEQEGVDRYPDYPCQSITIRERAAYIAGRTAAEHDENVKDHLMAIVNSQLAEIEKLKKENAILQLSGSVLLDSDIEASLANKVHQQIIDIESLKKENQQLREEKKELIETIRLF